MEKVLKIIRLMANGELEELVRYLWFGRYALAQSDGEKGYYSYDSLPSGVIIEEEYLLMVTEEADSLIGAYFLKDEDEFRAEMAAGCCDTEFITLPPAE